MRGVHRMSWRRMMRLLWKIFAGKIPEARKCLDLIHGHVHTGACAHAVARRLSGDDMRLECFLSVQVRGPSIKASHRSLARKRKTGVPDRGAISFNVCRSAMRLRRYFCDYLSCEPGTVGGADVRHDASYRADAMRAFCVADVQQNESCACAHFSHILCRIAKTWSLQASRTCHRVRGRGVVVHATLARVVRHH